MNDESPGQGRRGWPAAVIAVAASLALASSAWSTTEAPDSSGVALTEWAYDSWTVPWVQVKGVSGALAPASNATLMALACQTANLERDRLARHLTREDCEHRMAAIRADLDSSLIVRLDLRVFSFPGSSGLVRLDRLTSVTLEDDRGRRWTPLEIQRGSAVMLASGLKLQRIYYHPPWLRGVQHLAPYQYEPRAGRDLTVGEHMVRFARHDPSTGEPVVSSSTRWLRVRLSSPRNEWVATWTFRTPADVIP